MKLVCLSAAIFIFGLGSVSSLEWIDEDAIYIEDDTKTMPKKPPNGSIVVDIIPGQCVKTSECYPILFYKDEEDAELKVVDHQLYKFILSNANYCEPSDLPPTTTPPPSRSGKNGMIDDVDIYIWCPQRPSFPPRPSLYSESSKLSLNTTIVNETNNEQEEQTTTVPEEKTCDCGPIKYTDDDDSDEAKAKYRVVGGKETRPGEFPFVVAITNKGKQFCTGSILDERHILLAAHCLSHLRRRDLKNLRVLIGDHDISDPSDTSHQERNVTAIIYHSEFTMLTVHSDIGMIFLDAPIIFGENVAPICLPEKEPEANLNYDGSSYAILTGWGQTGLGQPASKTLMKTNLRIWRHEECVKKYQGKVPGGVNRAMICASSVAPQLKDACKGDSGGPLILAIDNKMQQIGIVSFGIGCGQYPGVFSKVSAYLNWIEKHRMRSTAYFAKT